MQIKVRTAILTLAIVTLVAYAFGRYSAPDKVINETSTKTNEVERKRTDETTRTDQDRNKRVERETVELVRPDGQRETRTKTVETTETSRQRETQVRDRETSRTESETQSRQEVQKATGRVNISVLAGLKLNDWAGGPKFGGHVSRNLLGPITIGVWGMTDLSCGVSLGLSF